MKVSRLKNMHRIDLKTSYNIVETIRVEGLRDQDKQIAIFGDLDAALQYAKFKRRKSGNSQSVVNEMGDTLYTLL